MSAASSPPCWARMVSPVLEIDFFNSNFFLDISTINHEKFLKKINKLNAESYLALSKKPKNKRHLSHPQLIMHYVLNQTNNLVSQRLALNNEIQRFKCPLNGKHGTKPNLNLFKTH